MNPTRSTVVAIFAGGWALEQHWRFRVAPVVDAFLGAVSYRFVASEQ